MDIVKSSITRVIIATMTSIVRVGISMMKGMTTKTVTIIADGISGRTGATAAMGISK